MPDGAGRPRPTPRPERDPQRLSGATRYWGIPISGEGGIRTPGWCYPTPVFKTGAAIPQECIFPEVTSDGNRVLPTGLPKTDLETGELPAKLGSDLQLIVDRWPALPEAIKAGIMAMVRAAGN